MLPGKSGAHLLRFLRAQRLGPMTTGQLEWGGPPPPKHRVRLVYEFLEALPERSAAVVAAFPVRKGLPPRALSHAVMKPVVAASTRERTLPELRREGFPERRLQGCPRTRCLRRV